MTEHQIEPVAVDGQLVDPGADLGDTLMRAALRRGIDPELLAFDPDPIDPRGNIMSPAEAMQFYGGNADKALDAICAGVFAPDRLPAMYPYVRDWVQLQKDTPATAPILLLRGITGCGKTSQSVLALRELVTWHAQRAERFAWYFITHRNLSSALQKNSGRDPQALMNQLFKADLVVLSDLGDVNNNDFGVTQNETSRLINHRGHYQLPTIYETNLAFHRNPNDPAQAGIAVLADYVDDRSISRLNGGWKINMPGTDYRATQGHTFPPIQDWRP